MNVNFEKLIQRNGTYSLPYLIYIHDEENTYELFFVNNNSDVYYDGNTYHAGAFSYNPNDSVMGFDGGGKLEISVKDNFIIPMIEVAKSVKLEVIGAINERGQIQQIKTFKHHYGTVSVSRTKATFTFDKDDRLAMTFPTLIWSNQNNRGNA